MTRLTRENQGYYDRLQRADSWIARARAILESGEGWDDLHGQFIFYWIAFNAVYGRGKAERLSDERDVRWFIELICDFDQEQGTIRSAVEPLKRVADNLLKDKYLCEFYWEQGTARAVERALKEDYEEAQEAWEKKEIARYLDVLFTRRLRVLRNQVFHGCSTDRVSRNRPSLTRAAGLLEVLIPAFVEVMRHHGKGRPWPPVPYPRVGSPWNPDS